MLLAIDTGNTHTKLGVINDNGRILNVFRLQTNEHRTEYEYAADMYRILKLGGINPKSITGSIISTVVPSLTGTLKKAVYMITGLDAMIVGAGLRTGLDIRLDDPGTIAPDFVCTAVAAKEMYPLPAFIISMGTATTVTVVDDKGVYRGGVIYAGVGISLEALVKGTSLLPNISIEPPKKAVASNTIEAMKAELSKGDVCAVIIEGIQGVGGIQLPTDEFMQALRQPCTEHNTVLILDEIQSGYGRSGKFFAHQYNGIKADIITVAKGIGNGFPMAGVLISPMFTPVYGQLGTTFGGNHLACSAALAVLDVIEQENLIENAAQVGNFLITELKKFPQIKDVRGRGLMIGLEFEEPIKELRLRLLKEQHVFTGVSGTNVLRLLPPLCLGMDEAKEFLERFKKVL